MSFGHRHPESALPIILIHESDSAYLLHTLLQAKTWNPRSEIILIGDGSNTLYRSVTHHLMREHDRLAQTFEAHYKHLSANKPRFELTCFRRWFLLLDVLTTRQIGRCVYIDSDVLVYSDLTEEAQKFEGYSFTLSRGSSPHCMFINDIGALAAFCGFLLNIYANPETLGVLERQFAQMKEANPFAGICDMTLFAMFLDREGIRAGETYHVIDGAILDHNINFAEPFTVMDGRKEIIWREGRPYGRLAETGELIRFSAIHFQGAAKRLIPQYQTGSSWEVLRAKILRKFFWIKQSAISFSRSILPILKRQ